MSSSMMLSSSSLRASGKKASLTGGGGGVSTRALLELEIGPLSGQYSCVYEGNTGVLCAGTKGLMFVGNYFLFENKLKIPWSIVRQVSKLDQGVQIWTRNKQQQQTVAASNNAGAESYIFIGIRQPNRVWPILVNLHNDALFDAPTSSSRASSRSMFSPAVAQQEYKRRNSDSGTMSASAAAAAALIEEEGEDDEEEKEEQKSTSPAVAKTSAAELEALMLPSTTVPGLTQGQVQELLGDNRMGPIACTHEAVAGNLFSGPKGLYFYGTIPWWRGGGEKRRHLSVANIRSIQILPLRNANDNTNSSTSNNEQQGLCIHFKDGTSYEFLNMQDPDRIWAALVARYEETKKNERSAAAAAKTAKASILRASKMVRTHSDPELTNASATMRDLVPMETVESWTTTTTTSDSAAKSRSSIRSSSARGSLREQDIAAKRRTATATSLNRDELASLLEEEIPDRIFEEDAEPAVDMTKEWTQRILSKTSDYPNIVVDQWTLPRTSLDEFVELFLCDQAEHSLIPNFLTSLGESEIQVTNWKMEDAGDIKIQTRVAQYIHPVNQPMVPPKAAARKEQRLTRFGDTGLCLESRTLVKDIPLTDCFHVDDRIRVTSSGPNDVIISIEFQITFVKSTMFKSVITKQTKAEVTAFFKKASIYMAQATEKPRERIVVSIKGAAAVAATIAPPPQQQQQQQQATPATPTVIQPLPAAAAETATTAVPKVESWAAPGAPPSLPPLGTSNNSTLDAWLLPFLAFIAMALPSVLLLQLYLLAETRGARTEVAALAKAVAAIQSSIAEAGQHCPNSNS